jgi:hypothetical protein
LENIFIIITFSLSLNFFSIFHLSGFSLYFSNDALPQQSFLSIFCHLLKKQFKKHGKDCFIPKRLKAKTYKTLYYSKNPSKNLVQENN